MTAPCDHLEIVVENPLGSTVRTIFDAQRGWVTVGPDFGVPLPAEYGYLPGTHNPADGEPVDVLVISYGPTFPGCRYRVRAIGVLLRADGDHKILAVPQTPQLISPVRDVSEVKTEVRQRIEDWFSPYFVLEGWANADRAKAWIEHCRNPAGEAG